MGAEKAAQTCYVWSVTADPRTAHVTSQPPYDGATVTALCGAAFAVGFWMFRLPVTIARCPACTARMRL